MQASSICNLELQMGQIVEELKNRKRGSPPSNTKAPRNSRNSSKKQCQVVTLRSQKPLTELPWLEKEDWVKRTIDNKTDQATNQFTTNHSFKQERKHSSTHDKQDDAWRISSKKTTLTSASFDTRSSPYPHMLRKRKNDEGQFQRFLDVLKQLHINIPLVDALE